MKKKSAKAIENQIEQSIVSFRRLTLSKLLNASIFLLSFCVVFIPLQSVHAQAQWGEAWSRNMISHEKGLPDNFDIPTGKNIKWKIQLGSEAHSTPVITKGKIFIGTNNEIPRDPKYKGDRGVFMCLNEADGSLLWQLVVPKLSKDKYQDWPKAGIVSTPVVDGDRVYIMDNRVEIMCLDINGLANGNDGPFQDESKLLTPAESEPVSLGKLDADIIWVFNVLTNADTYPHDGACASPILLGDNLYFNSCNGVDNTHRRIRKPDGPSLIVLDKNTGKYLARDNENIGSNIFHSTWSSPALGEVNGKKQIIFGGGNGIVYAFEPVSNNSSSNEVLKLQKIWQFDCDPTAPKENVHRFTSNRTTSPSNIKGTPVFYQNRVYVTVGGDLWWGKNQAWLKCIDATKTGDITQTGEIWSYPLDRHSMSTPSISDGLVYVADCQGKIHCVDAKTGAPYWVHDTESENWASTLVADGKVYMGTRNGVFWILAAGKEKKVISKIELDSPMSASPVVAKGILYVATMRQLYAICK